VGRAVGIVGLLGIALIHFLDAFGKFKETPYVGVLYILLMGVALMASVILLRTDSRNAWSIAAAAAGLTFLGYVISRTVGLPGATDDVGNWLEPLGVASLWVEGIIFGLGLYKVVTTPGIVRASQRETLARRTRKEASGT
jgi:hypothetical protein